MRGPTSRKTGITPGLGKIEQVIGCGEGNTHKRLQPESDIALKGKFISVCIISSITN